MRFLLTCAGTAGHINPALAIAGKLKEIMPDSEFLFVGSGREMENRLIPMQGFNIVNIKSTGFERSITFENLIYNVKSVVNLVVGANQAKKVIKDFRPDAVIGTGGYVCYPVIKTAKKLGIPTFIHESNAIPGLTTRMLSGIADNILVAFPNMENNYKYPEKVIFTGTPIRGEFEAISKQQAKKRLGLEDKPLVVSFWGSLGASRLDEATVNFIERNTVSDAFNHIHAAGQDGYDSMLSCLEGKGLTKDNINTDLRVYIDDMPVVMTAADVVMCRSGASTLGELTAIGRPSVLVPSPYVTDNHQEKNARRLEEAKGAVVVTENECSGELLFNTVMSIVGDRSRLEFMSEAVKKLGVSDSAGKIADIIISACN